MPQRLSGFILVLIVFSIFCADLAFANLVESRVVKISRSSSPINVDGVLDEPVWQTARPTTDFWQRYPYDSSRSELSTEVMVSYDDKFVYVAAVCYAKTHKDYVVESLRRDFNSSGNDAFYFVINPFNDRMSGYYTNVFAPRSRAIILKLTYWLNV